MTEPSTPDDEVDGGAVAVHFVIPHRGRTDYLCRTVQSIAALNTKQKLRISVITQDDATAVESVITAALNSQSSELGNRFSWRCLSADPSLTISALRNLGVQEVKSKYLAFLDADIALASDWLEIGLEELTRVSENRIIVSAVQRPSDEANSLELIRVALSNAHTDCTVDYLPGRNLLLRYADFENIGGFPEHLETCEDYYFTDRAADLGVLWYSAKTYYVHLGEDRDYDELFRKEIWRAKGNLRSLKGRGFSLKELPSLLVPVWVGAFTILSLAVLLLADDWLWVSLLLLSIPFILYVYRLHRIAPTIRLSSKLRFYLYYFPARFIGMVKGLFDHTA